MLVRRALAPLWRLRDSMRRIDPLVPGERLDTNRAGGDLSELAAAFNDMADRLEGERRESARRGVAGREDERRALGRELHDEVGQTLTAVLAHLEGVARKAPDELAAPLRDGQEGARAALEQVRAVVTRLRPDTLEDLGLVSALRALARRLGRQTDLEVSLALDGRIPPLEADAELVVYRIAQEALTNALRHADADTVNVELSADDGVVRLVVCDDGRGVPDGVQLMSGIRGMRERALLVGGTLQVVRGDRAGTEVRLSIPIRETVA
jgi:two-component system sensor histidine kinase UhpB